MASSRKRQEPSAPPDDLIALTVERFHQLFDSYENVWVSWSGGKDSTCVMECGAIAARERGIPLTVNFYDEEVIPRGTVELAERLRQRDDLEFRWHCIPIVDNNAWEPDDPYWYPWAPEAELLWVRPMPEWAITSVPGYDPDQQRYSLEYLDHHIAKALLPAATVSCIGRRMAESPVRGAIGRKLGWLQPTKNNRRYAAIASPIIDWNNLDVWNAILERGWDWNRAYMRMWQSGHPWSKLRIGPLFGEEPSSNAHLIRMWAPELWGPATLRIPGAQNLARYARSGLMGRGQMRGDAQVTVEGMVSAIEMLPADKRDVTLKGVRHLTNAALQNNQRIPAGQALKIALRGDSKAGRLSTSMGINAILGARKSGHYVPRGQSQHSIEENLEVAAKLQYREKHGRLPNAKRATD